MNDRVTVRTDRSKILDRIDLVFADSICQGRYVVNVNVSSGGFTVDLRRMRIRKRSRQSHNARCAADALTGSVRTP